MVAVAVRTVVVAVAIFAGGLVILSTIGALVKGSDENQSDVLNAERRRREDPVVDELAARRRRRRR